MRIHKHVTTLICIIACLALPTITKAQTAKATTPIFPERKYKPGESYRYRLSTEVVHNGQWQASIIAVCELKVATDEKGIPYDEIRWISKKVITAKDSIDQSEKARNVKYYRISLHKKGDVLLPPIDIADMTGEITDLNTFFVAISPKLIGTSFTKQGDSIIQKENVIGNFSNGKDILEGRDCLAVRTVLTANEDKHVQTTSYFLPPTDSCLQYYTRDLQTPVSPDTINNFQMVRPAGNDRFNVLYGNEQFIIKSTVSKKDGKLLKATMVNRLNLKIKVFCDKQYASCQTTMPYTMLRNLKLELLP
jgi:hypothetical protein